MGFKLVKTILLGSFFFCKAVGFSQSVSQKVGDNPGVINASAALDIESSSKGFLPPRMTLANRNTIVLPASGLIVFNTTSSVLEVNTGSPVSPIWTTVSGLDLTGDVTSSANVTTVKKINGIAMSGLSTGLLKNTAGTGVPSIAVVRADYAEPTTSLATGILKNTTSTGAHSIAVAADFPILNQNTTGNAATVTTNANLTGMVTSVGNTTTVVTNANLTGEATSVGNAVTLTNAAVIGKTLTGYAGAAGTVSASDNILQAIQKLDGNAALPSTVTVYTANGTYTPSPGVKWITVEAVGGGGAGGTAPATTGNANCAASGGGGAGGYRKVLVTKAQLTAASYSVTIGAGGTVSAAAGAGGTGGTTSFGTIITCNGGSGGVQSAVAANAVIAAGGNGGVSLSTAGTLVYALNGESGEGGYSTTASTTRFLKGGNGGDSFLGFGGINNAAVAAAGTTTFIAVVNYGGGGAGAALTGNASGAPRQGQAGAGGVLIVTEFF